MKVNKDIKKIDKELYNFLKEELSKLPDMPHFIEDVTYIPTEKDIQKLTEYQLGYYVMSANIDESDAIYDGGEKYELAKRRNQTVRKLVDEELKRRGINNEIQIGRGNSNNS